MSLDSKDLSLMDALQRNANRSSQDLGEQLHLSASQISRRRQRLEAEQYITGYVARLSAEKLGLTVQGFVQVQMATHNPVEARSFTQMLDHLPQVISAWTLTGDSDYLLKVCCTSLSDLNHLIQNRILPHPAVARVHSQIVMDQIKDDAPLPTGG